MLKSSTHKTGMELVLGTLFFMLLSYWLMTGSGVSSSWQEAEFFLSAILSAKSAWFLVLGWFLTTTFYLGFSHWSKWFREKTQVSHALRIIAFRRFKSSLWISLVLSFAFIGISREWGFLSLSVTEWDGLFLFRQLTMITDPLCSFLIIFAVLDTIRLDLFRQIHRRFSSMTVGFLVCAFVEVWVWSEFFGVQEKPEMISLLILAVLWGVAHAYHSVVSGRGTGFWSRLGVVLGLFVALNLGVSMVASPFFVGISFFEMSHVDVDALLMFGAGLVSAANAAVLYRFSRSLTRAA